MIFTVIPQNTQRIWPTERLRRLMAVNFAACPDRFPQGVE